MTEFEILSAVFRRKGRIMYLELMNIGLMDEKPDGVSDKRKIRALIKEGYLAGETRSEEWIRMTPKGYARMMELEVQEQNRSAAVKPKPRMKLMQRMKNSKLIRAIKHFIASRKEKRLLVSAWKQASEGDRFIVETVLRKYGFPDGKAYTSSGPSGHLPLKGKACKREEKRG